MDTFDSFHSQHIFWKAAIKHERTATHNFHDKNTKCLDAINKVKDLNDY